MKPGLLGALPILALLLSPPLAAQDTTAYRVASMRVFLFHETTGTIDTIDLVVPRDRGPFALDTTRSLRLEAQIDGRTVLERAVRLRSLFSEEHQVWVPFLLYGTGCGELKLTATIMRARQSEAALDHSIFFRCGE